MKISTASNSLKFLLFAFTLGLIFLGVYVLPTMSEEMLNVYPKLTYAKTPILIMCELLLLLFILGVGKIMHLIILFDRDLTFSVKFTTVLKRLVIMCIVAAIGIAILFSYVATLVGPGPSPYIVMIGLIFVVLIMAMVILLVHAIISKSITYKIDSELSV